MNKATTTAIHEHIVSEYPREACGLIIRANRKEVYVPCRNVAATASEHFIIHAADAASAEDMGKIIGLVHSHPNAPAKPSDADKVSCELGVYGNIPWYIYSVYPNLEDEGSPPKVTEEYAFKASGYRPPLIGRQFAFGILDCFTLIQDYYDWELGIKLPTPARRDQFWKRGEELYLENFKKMGFSPIEGPMEVGDIILMQVRSDTTNHAGIYLGDVLGVGSHQFLHHLYDQLSRRDVYGGYWADNTRMIVRKDK